MAKRTDIQIEAIAKQQRGTGFDRLRVITEVKGCWNPELPTGLQKQLVKRYLERLQTRHGIYLIANFQCAFWDDSDRRKKKAKTLSASLPTLRDEIEKLRHEQWHVEMPIMDFTRPVSTQRPSAHRRAGMKKAKAKLALNTSTGYS